MWTMLSTDNKQRVPNIELWRRKSLLNRCEWIEIVLQWRNKKVFLRERKRHTARRLLSTPSIVLPGSPPLLTYGGWGIPWSGTPLPPAGYPPPLAGYPPGRYPPQGTTPSRVPTRLDLAGYPRPAGPGRVSPLAHGILENVAKHHGIWVAPLGVDKLTKWNYYLSVVLRTRAVIICPCDEVFRKKNMKHVSWKPDGIFNIFLWCDISK